VPTRTVYTLASTTAPAGAAVKPEPRQVKVGITDGAFTEVSEGLNEGDTVVVGLNAPELPRMGGPQSSPFGGGGRRF
jgi:hypothetical protein